MIFADPNTNQAPSASLQIKESIHIWSVWLDATRFNAIKLVELLSIDELERANKYHFEKDRNSYIITRAALRWILSRYLLDSPALISIKYNTYGKPYLSNPAQSDLFFNVSHSGELALLAFTQSGPIGVDVEKVDNKVNPDAISSNFFSTPEIMILNQQSGENRWSTFYKLWTRKEALLKALGYGLIKDMNTVDISSDVRSTLSNSPKTGNFPDVSGWQVADLTPATGYVGAIAIQAPDFSLSNFTLSPEMMK